MGQRACRSFPDELQRAVDFHYRNALSSLEIGSASTAIDGNSKFTDSSKCLRLDVSIIPASYLRLIVWQKLTPKSTVFHSLLNTTSSRALVSVYSAERDKGHDLFWRIPGKRLPRAEEDVHSGRGRVEQSLAVEMRRRTEIVPLATKSISTRQSLTLTIFTHATSQSNEHPYHDNDLLTYSPARALASTPTDVRLALKNQVRGTT